MACIYVRSPVQFSAMAGLSSGKAYHHYVLIACTVYLRSSVQILLWQVCPQARHICYISFILRQGISSLQTDCLYMTSSFQISATGGVSSDKAYYHYKLIACIYVRSSVQISAIAGLSSGKASHYALIACICEVPSSKLSYSRFVLRQGISIIITN